MDVLEAIRSRRSCRKFETKDIPQEAVDSIVDCGRIAPSAGNRQPWVFIEVRDQVLKQKLVETTNNYKAFMGEAPVIIVVCGDAEDCAVRFEDRGRSLYVYQDCAAAVTNMLLAAVSYGLSTCWIGAFKESEARSALDLPPNLRPLTMIPLGYPDYEPAARPLKPREEVVWRR